MSTTVLAGRCLETSNVTFTCLCAYGWQGSHCETQVDYCVDQQCSNSAICRPSFLNFTCECLGSDYSGRHCEVKANQLVVKQAVCRSFSYIAIMAIISLATFIITMDIMKYAFKIDPVIKERQRIRQTKEMKNKRPPASIALRFTYVHSATTQG
jgi:hypothetical protein